MFARHFFALIATVGFSMNVYAHEYKVGDLQIGHPYARATVAGQTSGGAYLSIENKGKNNDKLVAVASPAAKNTEIHTMSMDGNVMKMREVGSIEIKPAEKIAMQPGNGYHIMLIGLTQQLKAGDKIPLTLTFEKAGKLDVTVNVEDKSNNKGEMEHKHH